MHHEIFSPLSIILLKLLFFILFYERSKKRYREIVCINKKKKYIYIYIYTVYVRNKVLEAMLFPK